MKCPKCGFNSFNYLHVCKKCGARLNPKSNYIPGISNTPEELILIDNQARTVPAADFDESESDAQPFISYEVAGTDSAEVSGDSDLEDISIGEDRSQTFEYSIPDENVEETATDTRENEYIVNRNSRFNADIIDNSSDDKIPASKDQGKAEFPDEHRNSTMELSEPDNVLWSAPDANKDDKGDKKDFSYKKTGPRYVSGEFMAYELASLGSRAAAFMIDILIVVLTAIAALVCGFFLLGAAGGMLYRDQNILISLFAGLLITASAYFLILQGYGGKTIGKMIMGIRLINYDGEPVGFLAAFSRWVGYYISAIFIFFGFIWPVFDSEYQAWHDKIAGTYVIKD